MDALVIYESLYGNTARIARAIGDGLTEAGVRSRVAAVNDVDPATAGETDLLVVGGPTHAHGMSRDATRKVAVDDAKNTYDEPTVAPGLRDWLDGLPDGAGRTAVAFDTRIHGPAFVTGSAARGIAKREERHGYTVTRLESFFVTKENELADGEAERAERWGAAVGAAAGR
jgi:flavodoxin